MKEVKWGVIGLGNIAHEFAEGMNGLNQRIYAVASRKKESLLEFKEKYAVQKTYSTYEELLDDPDVEAVYIALVNSEHYKWIIACIEHGKNVLCEKAIWGNYNDMEKAYALATEKGLILAEAMTIYHMPIFQKIKEMIREGVLGNIKFVEAELGSLKEDDPTNRFFNPELGGGAMLDIGTYGLSFVTMFLPGKITDATSLSVPYRTGADEMWGINLRTDTGQIGSVNLTFRAKLPKRGIIAGDKAYIVVMNYVRAEKATLVYPDGKEEIIEVGETAKAFQYEILDIEKALETKNPATAYIDNTKTVVQLMHQFLSEHNYSV